VSWLEFTKANDTKVFWCSAQSRMLKLIILDRPLRIKQATEPIAMSEYTRPPVTENANKVSYAHEVSVRFSLYGVDIIIAVAASHSVFGHNTKSSP